MTLTTQREITKKSIFTRKLYKLHAGSYNSIGYEYQQALMPVREKSKEEIIKFLKDLTKIVEDVSETVDKEFFKGIGWARIIEEDIVAEFLQLYDIQLSDAAIVSGIGFENGKYTICFKDASTKPLSGTL
jgi:hypothetical protein